MPKLALDQSRGALTPALSQGEQETRQKAGTLVDKIAL